MIRYLLSVGLVIGCMELPVQAKGLSAVTTQTPQDSSKPAKPISAKATTATSAPKTAPVEVVASQSAKASGTSTLSVVSSKQRTAREGQNVSCSVTTSETMRGGRLARLTAYWASEGDYYTEHGISSTGIHLHDGYCAVDPSIIPYGSVVEIAGLGKYLAVDTGSAVISREAAREAAHTAEERNALVIDLYFESRRDGQEFAANGPKYATISWTSPRTADNATKESIGLVAEGNWNKSPGKQL